VTHMMGMFSKSIFNQPIGTWDVSKVTNMNSMFDNSEFNQSIGDWNVSNVDNMRRMFRESIFNKDISNWCVILDVDNREFSDNGSLIDEYLPIWGTCPYFAPKPIKLDYPDSSDVNVELKTTFRFNKVDYAKTYNINIFNSDTSLILDETVDSLSFSLSDSLFSNRVYFWRVRGISDTTIHNKRLILDGEWSNTWQFKTKVIPPTKITLSKPENDSSGVNPEVDFTWFDAHADSFQIQVTTNDFESLIIDAITSDTFYTAPLDYNTQYKWRVRGINSLGEGEWSDSWSFATHPTITLDNGIIKCKGVPPGFTRNILGKEYEVVNKQMLNLKIQNNQPINTLCVSNITYMNGLFRNSLLVNPDFANTESFNIETWDVSNVTDMGGMFAGTVFNQDISNWDISNVSNMGGMFENSEFNKPIGNWDVSNVTSMSNLFKNSLFNQDISNWNVEKVTHTIGMFEGSQFNQPIGDWNFKEIHQMYSMFKNSVFNQPLEHWNVFNNTDFRFMFQGSQFNQDISDWCVLYINTTPIDFSTDGALSDEYKPLWGQCPIRPLVPNRLSPIQEQQKVPRDIIFKWTGDSLSTNYRLQLFKGLETLVVDTLVTSMSFNINDILSPNTQYYWRMQGVNKDIKRQTSEFSALIYLSSEWSDYWSFTTGTFQRIDLKSPSNDTLLIGKDVTFNWTIESSSEKYNLQISSDDFETLHTNEITTNNTAIISELSYNTKYSWRVRAISSADTSSWSEVWDFTTVDVPLISPPLSTPFNEQVNVGTLTEFTWNEVESSVSYHLQVSTDEGFSSFVFDSSKVGSTSFTLSEPLNENTTYFWRMKSISDNELRNSEWSDTLTFTTGVRTSIEDELIPQEYILSQNYPNPFNPSTQIQYALPEATQVTLEVFNSVGQKVMEMVNGQKSAGYHTATFDASGLSSGVYLYKLTTPSFSQTNKMLLIK
jgi:surface protein